MLTELAFPFVYALLSDLNLKPKGRYVVSCLVTVAAAVKLAWKIEDKLPANKPADRHTDKTTDFDFLLVDITVLTSSLLGLSLQQQCPSLIRRFYYVKCCKSLLFSLLSASVYSILSFTSEDLQVTSL
jgi:hypothetical protein